MEYFDSKVLESFMIPEDSIATEGFKDTAFKIIKSIFIFINRIIEKLIIMIKKVLGALGVIKDPNYNKKSYMENRKNVVEIDKVIRDAHLEINSYYKDIIELITPEYIESHEDYTLIRLNNLPSVTDRLIDKCNKAIEKMNGKIVYFDNKTTIEFLKQDISNLEKLKSDIDNKIRKIQNPEKMKMKKC